MINVFLIKLIISFVVGVIWITSVTYIAEKLGTKLGGAIAGVPSTMLITLFFIGWTQSPLIASQSTTLIPIIVGLNALVAMVYVLISKYNLIPALFSALSGWFILSFIFLKLKLNYLTSILGFIVCVGVTYIVLEKILKIKSKGKTISKKSFKQLLFRGAISGSVISFAVFMAKIGGPEIGGVFASFPVMTVAIIIISHLSQGIEYTAALLKNFIISGAINVLIFVTFIKYTYLFLGLILGTSISFLISLFSVYLTYNLINKKMN